MSTSGPSTLETTNEGVQPAELSQYLAHFHEHITHVQHHAVGHDSSNPMLPSYYPPCSNWTGAEKDRFFHALTLYSRFRPDLVAEHIGTKTFTDVCVYLDMLEEALQNSDSISSGTGLKFVPLQRNAFPSAFEISDEWLEYEDELAAALVASEPTLLADSIERTKDDEIHEHRRSLRAKKGASRSTRDRDREGEKARNAQLQEWLEKRKSEWAVEEVLRSLGAGQLRAIDAILREDEESWAIPTESTQGSKQSDKQADVAQAGDHIPPVSEADEVPSDAEAAADQEVGRLTEAAVASLPTEEAPLSPASRRRLRKRLYMRRKRAEKTGEMADQSTARLKPGRKGKSREVDLEQQGSDEDSSGDEKTTTRASGKTLPYKIREQLDDLSIDAVRLRQDGLGLFHATAMSNLMRTYNNLHDVPEEVASRISAHTIQKMHTLLVEFISQIVRQSIVSREQERASKANTKAWRLAESPIITTSNVKHALSLLSEKSFDRRNHFGTMLERLDLEEEAEEDEEEDEGDAIADEDDTAQQSEAPTVEEDTFEADDKGDSTLASQLHALPLKRVVFPPHVRLPRTFAARGTHTSHSYMPWTTSSLHHAEDDDEEILSSDTDDEALDNELADEEELDEQDRIQQSAYETRLWLTFRPPPEEAELVLEHAGVKRKRGGRSDDARPKRKYRARVNKAAEVKSAPYIEDSDIDL